MGQWQAQRAARLGPASPGKRDTVHGHIARTRNGRFESRDVANAVSASSPLASTRMTVKVIFDGILMRNTESRHPSGCRF